MSSVPYAFEHDKTSVFIRNQFMHIHFKKLNKIQNRKSSFLPVITTYLQKTKGSPSKFPTHTIQQKYVINRDNRTMFKKLNAVCNRSCQAIKDEGQIDKYLEMKKSTREGIRQIKTNLLFESNIKIKERIQNTKPVLNKTKMKEDFDQSRFYYNNLRKIKPSQSVCELFLTKNESKMIERYTNELSMKNRNNSSVNNRGNKQSIKINKNILSKIGYTTKGRANSKE